jgi:hypothetical protein
MRLACVRNIDATITFLRKAGARFRNAVEI